MSAHLELRRITFMRDGFQGDIDTLASSNFPREENDVSYNVMKSSAIHAFNQLAIIDQKKTAFIVVDVDDETGEESVPYFQIGRDY